MKNYKKLSKSKITLILRIVFLTSMYTWHMVSRWYTSDLHTVFTDMSHSGTMVCIPSLNKSVSSVCSQDVTAWLWPAPVAIACRPESPYGDQRNGHHWGQGRPARRVFPNLQDTSAVRSPVGGMRPSDFHYFWDPFISIRLASDLQTSTWRKLSPVCYRHVTPINSMSGWKPWYSRINSTKSPVSGAGNISEPRLIPQDGRVREVVCA